MLNEWSDRDDALLREYRPEIGPDDVLDSEGVLMKAADFRAIVNANLELARDNAQLRDGRGGTEHAAEVDELRRSRNRLRNLVWTLGIAVVIELLREACR